MPDETDPQSNEPLQRVKGRGAQSQSPNRFESVHLSVEPTESTSAKTTQYLTDQSQSIVSQNSSPDIPFRYSINPYRGCEHGCSYCYARPTHEFLGMSAGIDFESKIIVKDNAVDLLRTFLARPKWKPESMMMSGVTDPYQPIERDRKITRGILRLMLQCRHPISVITKNALIERDLDLLQALATDNLVHVAISITTLDRELAQVMEPRTSSPDARFRAIKTLADAGVPVRIMAAPVIPGLNDHEIPELLSRASDAGATTAGYVMLRLPGAVQPIFEEWLSRVRPNNIEKVLAKIQEVRDGAMNDTAFRSRMRGTGVRADSIAEMFKLFAQKKGLGLESKPLACDRFVPPASSSGQMSLF
ncbi:PA0069 family radical SAM protein [Planctomycetes bacterium K23_9]|uniref:PA0069 family radical SAM protein n=1 Tax=Stieleria marina TaxID=1930275 RepID=UPI0011AA64A8